MNHSAKTDYAAMAVFELARCWSDHDPVRIRDISTIHAVPARFLVHILLQLKAAGLVTSTRGAAGGYRLARPPGDITLEDVVRIFEGPFRSEEQAILRRAGHSRSLAPLRRAWQDVAAAEAAALRSITFADLVERARLPAEAMYYI